MLWDPPGTLDIRVTMPAIETKSGRTTPGDPWARLVFEHHRYTRSSPAAQAEHTPRPPPGHLKPPTCRIVTCSPCPFVTLLILLPKLSIRFTLNSKERGRAATLPAGICRPVFLQVSTHNPSLLRPVFFFRSPLSRSHPFIRLCPCQPPALDGGGTTGYQG